MILHPLILELSEILPADDTERDAIARVVSLVLAGTPIWRGREPDQPDPHLVSYFPLIDLAAGAILLGAHRKAGLWLPPGGHVEEGEHPRATARRECQEGLRIDATFLHPAPLMLTITTTRGPRPHDDISLWYALKGDAGQMPDYDRGEYSDMRWFDMDKLPLHLTDPCLGAFVDKLTAPGGKISVNAPRTGPESLLRAMS